MVYNCKLTVYVLLIGSLTFYNFNYYLLLPQMECYTIYSFPGYIADRMENPSNGKWIGKLLYSLLGTQLLRCILCDFTSMESKVQSASVTCWMLLTISAGCTGNRIHFSLTGHREPWMTSVKIVSHFAIRGIIGIHYFLLCVSPAQFIGEI